MNSILMAVSAGSVRTRNREYGAVGWDGAPYLTFFYKQGASLFKLTDPATMPTEPVIGVEWSRIGNFCLVHTSTRVYVYQASGTSVTVVRNDLSPQNYKLLRWGRETATPSDTNNTIARYWFVAWEASDVIGYRRGNTGVTDKTSGVFNVEASTVPSSTANFVDAAYLLGYGATVGSIVSISTTGNKLVFNELDGLGWSELTGRALTMPTGTPSGVASRRDGTAFAVLTDDAANNVLLYTRSGANWDISKTATISGEPSRCNFSNDGRYLAVVYDTSPYFAVVDFNPTTPTVTAGSSALSGAPSGVQASFDGRTFVTASAGATPVQVHVRQPDGTYDLSTIPDFGFAQPNATALSLKNNAYFT